MFQAEEQSESIQIGKLWVEIKDWRKHWKVSDSSLSSSFRRLEPNLTQLWLSRLLYVLLLN